MWWFLWYFVFIWGPCISASASENNNVTDSENNTVYLCSNRRQSLYYEVDANYSFDKEPLIFQLARKNGLACRGAPNYHVLHKVSPSKVQFMPTGHLKIIEKEDYGLLYSPSEYCIGNTQDLEIHYCKSSCTEESNEVCVAKCCPPGFVVDYSSFTHQDTLCRRSGRYEWRPNFYDAESLNGRCVKEVKQPVKYRLTHRSASKLCGDDEGPPFPFPRTHIFLDGQPRSSWRLLQNGSVVHKNSRQSSLSWTPSWSHADGSFCVDGLKNVLEGPIEIEYPGPSARSHQMLIQCSRNFETIEEANVTGGDEVYEDNYEEMYSNSSAESITIHPKNAIYISALFLSLIPLGITIAVYWLTWSTQNIHGWTMFSHIVSLFFMNFFLGLANVTSLFPDDRTNFGCVFIAVMAHFFVLSAFFWLTMVNFDLWSTFRHLKQNTGRSKDLLPFLGYALFSWGGPLVIVFVAVFIDSRYGNFGYDSDCGIIIPEYGIDKCYMSKSAEGVFLYFIIGALLLFNVGFFMSLVVILYRHKRGTRRASRRKSVADVTSGELFAKLFIVMGFSFTLEVISWIAENDTQKMEDISWVWVFFDFLNILARAIFIFVIFVCKARTMKELRKYCPEKVWQCICVRETSEPEESGNFSGSATGTSAVSTQGIPMCISGKSVAV